MANVTIGSSETKIENEATTNPLGEALRLLRVFHDKSAAELAKELSYSRSYVSELERGHKTPSTEVIERYASVFRIPVSSIWFFHERLSADGPKGPLDRLGDVVAAKVLDMLRFIERKADL